MIIRTKTGMQKSKLKIKMRRGHKGREKSQKREIWKGEGRGGGRKGEGKQKA